MWVLAWHEKGETFLVVYADAAQAHSNLAKALEVDPSAKLVSSDSRANTGQEEDWIDLGWDGTGEPPF